MVAQTILTILDTLQVAVRAVQPRFLLRMEALSTSAAILAAVFVYRAISAARLVSNQPQAEYLVQVTLFLPRAYSSSLLKLGRWPVMWKTLHSFCQFSSDLICVTRLLFPRRWEIVLPSSC